MHGPINVKFPNNISKWQMGFNSAFKGLILFYFFTSLFIFASSLLFYFLSRIYGMQLLTDKMQADLKYSVV